MERNFKDVKSVKINEDYLNLKKDMVFSRASFEEGKNDFICNLVQKGGNVKKYILTAEKVWNLMCKDKVTVVDHFEDYSSVMEQFAKKTEGNIEVSDIKSFRIKDNSIKGLTKGMLFTRENTEENSFKYERNQYLANKSNTHVSAEIHILALEDLIKKDKIKSIKRFKSENTFEQGLENMFEKFDKIIADDTKEKAAIEKVVNDIDVFVVENDFSFHVWSGSFVGIIDLKKGTVFYRNHKNNEDTFTYEEITYEDVDKSETSVLSTLHSDYLKYGWNIFKNNIQILSRLSDIKEDKEVAKVTEHNAKSIYATDTINQYRSKSFENLQEEIKKEEANQDSEWIAEYIKEVNNNLDLINDFRQKIETEIKSYQDKYEAIEILDELEFDKKEEKTVYFNIIEALKKLL